MKLVRTFFLCLIAIQGVLLAESSEDIFFLHIPKTGGCTLHYQIFNQYLPSHNGTMSTGEFAWGHATVYGLNHHCVYRNYKRITFLRNPVDRVASEYRHWIRFDGNEEQSKSHHLQPGNPIETANNIVCRLLSGLDPCDSSISIEKYLSEARKQLASFYFVGITEKMNESIELLFSLFNWTVPEKVHAFDVSNNYETLSNDVLDKIRANNWADIELYEYALELYQKQLNTIKVFSEAQILFPFSNLHLSFSCQLNGYGWTTSNVHGWELVYDGKRWVDEYDEAVLNGILESGHDYDIEFSVYIHVALATCFSVSVNDYLIPLRMSVSDPTVSSWQFVTFKGIIPANVIKSDILTRIMFKLNTPPGQAELKIFSKWEKQQCKKDVFYKKGHFALQTMDIYPVTE